MKAVFHALLTAMGVVMFAHDATAQACRPQMVDEGIRWCVTDPGARGATAIVVGRFCNDAVRIRAGFFACQLGQDPEIWEGAKNCPLQLFLDQAKRHVPENDLRRPANCPAAFRYEIIEKSSIKTKSSNR